jgi:uncharacterized membrane protein
MHLIPSRDPAAHRGTIRNLNDIRAESLTFGQRLADRVAAVGGSWGFIIGFGVFLVVWTVANSVLLGRAAFDAYPYIFLNLILSMIAAIQAPIIMMSQNRAAAHDRAAAQLDYDINTKAEREVVAIHDRMDREITGLHLKMDALLRQAGIDPQQVIEAVPAGAPSIRFSGDASVTAGREGLPQGH